MTTQGVVYKIFCRNQEIKEIYVGSTKNLAKRIASHRLACSNPNKDIYSYFVYQFIRDNGGFDNWDVDILERVEFTDIIDLRRRERHHIETLGAQLNSCIPTRTDKEWREQNHEIIAQKKHDYAIQNSAIIVEKVRQWRLKDPERTKAKRALEWQKHKEKLSAEVVCACGHKHPEHYIRHHVKSKQHKNYLASQNNPSANISIPRGDD